MKIIYHSFTHSLTHSTHSLTPLTHSTHSHELATRLHLNPTISRTQGLFIFIFHVWRDKTVQQTVHGRVEQLPTSFTSSKATKTQKSVYDKGRPANWSFPTKSSTMANSGFGPQSQVRQIQSPFAFFLLSTRSRLFPLAYTLSLLCV